MTLVVVDAVHSMDGDIAQLPELIALRGPCLDTLLMVDEAHSLGVRGTGGRAHQTKITPVGQTLLRCSAAELRRRHWRIPVQADFPPSVRVVSYESEDRRNILISGRNLYAG